MTPEDIVKIVLDELSDVYDESDIRGWLEQPGEYLDKMPSEIRSSVLSIKLKRDARDVMFSFPYWLNVPEFLEFWNDQTISERFALMASDSDDETPSGCDEE
jgi:hypothetical protein